MVGRQEVHCPRCERHWSHQRGPERSAQVRGGPSVESNSSCRKSHSEGYSIKHLYEYSVVIAFPSPRQIFSKSYHGLERSPSYEEDDEFVIDSTVGRNVTFQLDFDNAECNFNNEDDGGEDDGDGDLHILHVDIYYESVEEKIMRYSFNTDNENDNYRVDVFKFTIDKSVATHFHPGTYRVKVSGGKDKPDCTMTLLITSLAVDDEATPIRYQTFNV